MKQSQNYYNINQLSLDFNKKSKPVIWQWHELPPKTRAAILELAGFNAKAIASLSQQQELEPWIKCTLNWIMKLTSKGWLDLRFDELYD